VECPTAVRAESTARHSEMVQVGRQQRCGAASQAVMRWSER